MLPTIFLTNNTFFNILLITITFILLFPVYGLYIFIESCSYYTCFWALLDPFFFQSAIFVAYLLYMWLLLIKLIHLTSMKKLLIGTLRLFLFGRILEGRDCMLGAIFLSGDSTISKPLLNVLCTI